MQLVGDVNLKPKSGNFDNKDSLYDLWWKKLTLNPKELKNAPLNIIDYNMCLMVIRNYGYGIANVPNHIIDVRLIVYALKRDGMALSLLPENIRTLELCTIACEADSHVLKLIPETFIPHIAPSILKMDGTAIKFITRFVDQNMCDIAVQSNPLALQYVPKHYQNKELVFSAVQRNGDALQFVWHDLFTNELVELALANDRFGWVATCLPREWYSKYKGQTKPLNVGIPDDVINNIRTPRAITNK